MQHAIYWPSVFGLAAAAVLLIIGGLFLTGRRGLRRRLAPYDGQPVPGNKAHQVNRDRRDARQFGKYGWGALLLGLALALYTAFPFSLEYHRYELISGTVTGDVGERLMSTGNSKTLSQVYAVPIGAEVFRCDDTRCSLLRQGDQVSLWCVREWQWTGTPGWDCRFDSAVPAANRAG